MADFGERKKRLHRTAARLRPRPEAMPYYLQRPQGRQEPAPGWYMIPADAEHPTYLGYGAIDAELTLREMLERQEQGQPA